MKFRLNSLNLAFLLVLPVFSYINLRAWFLAFTYDESWTFLGYATEDFWKVVTNEFPAANNHVLHSLIMGWVYELFGQQEYILRLPVLLSFVVFAYFSYEISKSLSKKMWWLPFIMVIYQPYLLDYFVAARGYALALAFMMGAIYFLFRFSKQLRLKWAWYSLIFAALAAYSNFTYLLLFIAISMGVTLLGFTQKKKFGAMLPVVTIGSILGLMVYIPITQLIMAKELYYGGEDGFFEDTLMTLARSFIYGYSESNVLAWVFVLIIALAGVFAMQKLFLKAKLSMGFWIAFILIIIEIGSILQHHLLDSPYLIDRTAIFFIPLILFACSWIVFQFKESIIRNIVAFMFVGLSILNLLIAVNFSYLLDFKEHSDTKSAMLLIANDQDLPEDGFVLGKSIYMNATVNFYRVKLGLERIEQSGLEFCEETEKTKYYYLFEKDISCLENKDVELMQYFPVSETYLYRSL